MIRELLYNGVKMLARTAVQLFYHPIEINGLEHIPKDSGHLIFAPNHQSAFLDAVLVAIFSTRPIYFLTRADVFVFPFDLLLRSLNMMPVYRKRDGYGTLSKNEAVFNACRDLIREGKPILLFPEASQKLVFYLRPLSRGLSRIALNAQDGFDKPVYIIPVGINYFNQLKGGCKLILNFGQAVNVKDQAAKHDAEGLIYNEIRMKTSEALKETLLIPEKDTHYKEKQEYLKFPYYDLSFTELRDRIDAMGEKFSSEPPVWRMVLVLILSIPNVVFHAIQYLVIKYYVADPTFHASIKISLIMFVYPLCLIVSFILAGLAFGYGIAAAIICFQVACFYFRMRNLKYVI